MDDRFDGIDAGFERSVLNQKACSPESAMGKNSPVVRFMFDVDRFIIRFDVERVDPLDVSFPTGGDPCLLFAQPLFPGESCATRCILFVRMVDLMDVVLWIFQYICSTTDNLK